MVGQVHQRIGIGIRVIGDAEAVVLRQPEQHLDLQISGVVLFSVRGCSPAEQALVLGGHAPELLVKALFAAVQVVFPVVFVEDISFPVQGEFRLADPVSDPADGRAEVVAVFQILLCGVVTEHDIHRLPVPIGDAQRLHRRAVIQHGQGRPCMVRQFGRRYASSVGELAEFIELYCHVISALPFDLFCFLVFRHPAPVRGRDAVSVYRCFRQPWTSACAAAGRSSSR